MSINHQGVSLYNITPLHRSHVLHYNKKDGVIIEECINKDINASVLISAQIIITSTQTFTQ